MESWFYIITYNGTPRYFYLKSADKINLTTLKAAVHKILLSPSIKLFNKHPTSTCCILGTELNIRDTDSPCHSQISTECFRKPKFLPLGSLILVEEA